MSNKPSNTKTAKQIVVVLGMHRSGTSAVSGVLSILGVEFGSHLIGSAKDNETGFWEDESVVQLNDRILAKLGMDWKRISAINSSTFYDDSFSPEIDEAEAILASHFPDQMLFGIKDPRLCRVLPIWNKAFARLTLKCQYLLVVRSPAEVAASLMHRNNLPLNYGYALWLRYTLDAIRDLQQRSSQIVLYSDLLESTSTSLERIVKGFSLEVTDTAFNEAEQFVKDEMRHHANSLYQASGLVEDIAFSLYGLLKQVADNDGSISISNSGVADIMARCQAVSSVFTQLDAAQQFADYAVVKEKAWLESVIARNEKATKVLSDESLEKSNYISSLEQEDRKKCQYIFELEKEEARKAEYIIFLENENGRKSDYIISLENENGRKSDYIISLEKNNHSLNDRCKDIELKLNHADAELARVWEIQYQTRLELDRIYNSRSWRFSSPARHFSHFTRRVVRRLSGVLSGLFTVQPLGILYQKVRRLLKRTFLQTESNASNRAMMQQLAKTRSVLKMPEVCDCEESALPNITISVVTYNSERWISDFFESLSQQNYPLSKIDLHFVDNGSSDSTVSKLKELEQQNSVFNAFNIYQQSNKGFGAGHDVSIGHATTRFVLVSNIDLEFELNSIVNVVNFALFDSDKTASWELRQKPFEHPKYYDPITLETAWSSHACVLLDRDAYLQVGGYEKKIFMYGEDVELSYRLRDRGFSVKYVPHAVVWHFTYEHENEVKPLQLTGSTLANAYIRLRYGSFSDILAIFGLYFLQIYLGVPLYKGRTALIKNLGKVIVNAPYFLCSRKKSNLRFPFRGWDYETQREGAFYNHPRLAQQQKIPKVSVITRTYPGRGKWLREALVSVLRQTYPNIELVIVEDGGDTHRDFIESQRHHLPPERSIIYSAQPKHGRSYNGNVGLAMATGEYCVFLDDDDLMFPDHIEVLMSEIQNREDLAGVYSLSWEIYTDYAGAHEHGHYLETQYVSPDVYKQEFSLDVLRDHNFLPIQSVLFRRELFNQFGGFAVDMDALEDWDLWVRYASDKPFKYVPKTTSLFRTPADPHDRAERHEILHASYDLAIERQRIFFTRSSL